MQLLNTQQPLELKPRTFFAGLSTCIVRCLRLGNVKVKNILFFQFEKIIYSKLIMSNKHIYFDDEDEVESKGLGEEEPEMIHLSTQPARIECVLVKLKNEASFGFEINGQCNLGGKHYIDNIVPNSPACRAELRSLDKIISVNGINVASVNVDRVIEIIQRETPQGRRQLDLVVHRDLNAAHLATNASANLKRKFDCKFNHRVFKFFD